MFGPIYNNNNNNNNNIYLLQLGCYPVAVVVLHVNKHEIGYYIRHPQGYSILKAHSEEDNVVVVSLINIT